ncbi:MAG: HAMP domain-containing sensor histidine kinase [Eubacteriales bacterium]|nr:HAMP domain-containing sensor histidine kinase [Eubacteriales bacterium]
MRFRSIKTRWLFIGVGVVLTLTLLAVVAFSFSVHGYYYSSMRASLESKAKTASEFFTSYVSRTYAEYYQSAHQYTQEFEDRDVLELQFLNTSGRVEISSYGISADPVPNTSDVQEALQTGEISYWCGKRNTTGERIMAVSAPLLYSDGSVVGVMRYITSTHLLDRQIRISSGVAACVGLAVTLLVLLSNLYFIRTIIDPIRSLTGVARRIAEGSYGIQLEKKYDDEIGELIDTINEMSEKISRADKMQTEFVSSVSHELRTPLTAIKGWSETLAYDETIQGDSRRGLEIISGETARLTKMVEELLEFTRLQDGRFTLSMETIDLRAVLEDSLATYAELFRRAGIMLEYRPPREAVLPVVGDAQRLKQVFLNLLDNASKYGRDSKRIDVSLSRGLGSVIVSFRDYGPGIPPNELPHVKERFYKGSSRERGSGIGLAVCDEIVTRHKGTLTLSNASGGGLLVSVRIPLRP